MNEILLNAFENRYAVPSFCVWDTETAWAVLRVAERKRSPVILMCGTVELALLPPKQMATAILPLIEQSSVQAALHLDHGDSIETVKSCIEAGFNSVMLDYSHLPFEENAAALRTVSEMVSAGSIAVEGELGAVGKVDSSSVESGGEAALTDPKQAAEYVESTGIHALAVAIGNAHGNYREDPKLDFERLKAIRKIVDIPLVLHGGSGTPRQDLERAIDFGIAKVNVASELVRALRESLMKQWNRGENVWVPVAFGEALGDLEDVVSTWIDKTGSAGRSV